MKRFGQFVIVMLVFLVFAYMKPIFSPNQVSKKPRIPEEKTDVVTSNTSFPYDEMPTTGLAKYIDQDTSELTKDLGEPIEIQHTALGYDWWMIGEDEKDYIQVAVRKGKVASIFSLGEDNDVAPFELGMDLADISELTTIYSNFKFEKKGKTVSVELTEEDMNYRPLVAFDNESFAILHLNQGTGKLIGVRYLNKSTLLRLMPYQLNEGELSEEVISKDSEWSLVEEDSKRQLLTILNILRHRQHLPPYDMSAELSSIAQKSLTSFMEHPEQVIKKTTKLESWEGHEQVYAFNQPFDLSSDEFKRLLSVNKLNNKDVHGILYSPAYDVPFLALSWYGEVIYQAQFTHKNDKEVGIAFNKDAVLFLFSEKEEATEMSNTEQSEREDK